MVCSFKYRSVHTLGMESFSGCRELEFIETNLYLPVSSQTLSKLRIFVYLQIFTCVPL